MLFDKTFIQRAIHTIANIRGIFPENPQFSIDSRSLCEGDIFVALLGNNCDGHDFISEALTRKAAGVIVSVDKTATIAFLDNNAPRDFGILIVADPYHAFLDLATAWRALFTGHVIGITGSVGKTSTKEFIAHIIKTAQVSAYTSYHNQNTPLGIALNIFSLRQEHAVAIFEIGIAQKGEMEQSVAMLRPTIGVITQIGHAHVQGLGSLQSIGIEKRNIFKYFSENNIGIVNGDQSILSQVSYKHPIIKFGLKTTNQIQARKIQRDGNYTRFVLKIYRDKYDVAIPSIHPGTVTNVLAAAAVTELIRIPHHSLIQAISQLPTVKKRFEQCNLPHHANSTVINDSYNANPTSMKAGLLAFHHTATAAYKIAVLGEMRELGAATPFWHRQLGRFLKNVPSVHHIILVGPMTQWIKKTAPLGLTIDSVTSWNEALELLLPLLTQKSFIFVKGSLMTEVFRIVDALVEKKTAHTMITG